MKAVKSCFADKTINWEMVGSQANKLANRILGGIWNSGASPYVHCCSNASELYVSFVEERRIWLQRNVAGQFGKINADGFFEIMV